MTQDFSILLTSALGLGGIYSLIALSLSSIYRCTGILFLAIGEVMVLSLFVYHSLSAIGMPLFSLISQLILIILFMCLLYYFPLRFLKGRPLQAILITIALSWFLKGMIIALWDKNILIPKEDSFFHFSEGIQGQYLNILFWLVGILIALAFFFKSKMGISLRAIQEDEKGALLTGIPVEKMIYFAFGLSGVLASISVLLISPVQIMDYQSGSHLTIKGFTVFILSGMHKMRGIYLAGLLVGFMEVFTAYFLGGEYKDIVTLLLLVGILAMRNWKRGLKLLPI